ncbi:ATP-binding cassette domain-containing protein [Streptomyces sp. NPDC093085]|uniref:ABC transporter ATP-binding protein n=1 Tax=Streptomyces sp. NPDC093085 TaxID=3155068 RepID=UPI003437A3BF
MTDPATTLLKLAGVVGGYGRGLVLQGVDIQLTAGTIGCIVGPNGAGKSSVLRAVSGLLDITEGSLRFAGSELRGLDAKAILELGISQVPQAGGLFPNITVRENVLMGAWTVRRDRRRVRRRLAEIEELFPVVAQRAGTQASDLSGGQRRAVEFARALMLEPRLVLLDEPTLGLDPKAMAVLQENIVRMKDTGTTVLLVEQQVKFGLGIADTGIVMEGGRVLLTGDARKILSDPDMGSLFFGNAAPAHASGSAEDRAPLGASRSSVLGDSAPREGTRDQ